MEYEYLLSQFDFNVEDILFSDFKNFESSAFINLNESNVEYEFKEEENTLYDIMIYRFLWKT